MLRTLFASIAILIACAAPAQAEDPVPYIKRLARLPRDLVKADRTDAEIVDALFLATLARLPKADEKEKVMKHITATKGTRAEASVDIAWALVNTKEFLKLHGLDKDTEAALKLLNKHFNEPEPDEKKEDKKPGK